MLSWSNGSCKLEERKNYLIKQSKLKYYNAARELVAQSVELPTGESPEEKEELIFVLIKLSKRQEGKPVEFGHKLLNIGEHRRHFQLGLIADVAAQQDTIMKQIIKDEDFLLVLNVSWLAAWHAFTQFMDQNLMNFDERVVSRLCLP